MKQHARSNEREDLLKLTFLGDALFDNPMADRLERYRSENGFDFNASFAPLREFLNGSDYVMANLETPITTDPECLTKTAFQFCTDIAYAQALKENGVDYVSTANNHCLDRGLDGIRSTIECLDKLGLDHSGTYLPGKRRSPLIVECGALRLGLLSYTYGTNAVSNKEYLPFRYRRVVDLIQEQEGSLAPWDPLCTYVLRRPGGRIQRFREDLHCRLWPRNKARQWYEWENWGGYRRWLLMKDIRWLRRHGADKIAIFLHVGGQYNQAPAPLTLRLTRWLERKKVDMVIANHEHVIHGSKVEDGRLTTYALGNLIGSAGTLKEPLDRHSEYSIATHVYVNKSTRQTQKITYSVLKTVVMEDQRLSVWPVYDLLPTLSEDERKKVTEDTLHCAQIFSGSRPQQIEAEFTRGA